MPRPERLGKRKRKPSRRERGRTADDRKDRLVQTRVPRDLESALKEEAGKRRLTVSHLIRNVLEDALDIVDDVVAGVDDIVSDSMGMAQAVQQDATRLARRAVRGVDSVVHERRGAAEDDDQPDESEPPEAPADPLAHVDAWNRVTLNKNVDCASCGNAVTRGSEGALGVSSDPSAPTTWLCGTCLDSL